MSSKVQLGQKHTHTHTQSHTHILSPTSDILKLGFFLLSSELLHLECETMRPAAFVRVTSHRATIWPVRDQWGQTIDLTQRAPRGGPSGAVPGWVPSRLHALSISWQRSMRRPALWRSLPGDGGQQAWADGLNACLHAELDFWSLHNAPTHTHL